MTRLQLTPEGGSAYLQVYRGLKAAITDGSYPPGSRLPSKRQLAEELGISVITVEHAYALLIDEGYAAARERSGFFVPSEHIPAAAVRPAAVEEMRLPAAAPKDFPFSALARIMRRVLSERGEQLLEKSPPCGCMALRSALRQSLLRSRGLDVSEEQIVVGSGAEYLYALCVQLLGRERPFALENPCYEKIRRIYELGGAVCEGLAMGPEGIESAALAASTAGVLHVTPYHSFPSGITATASKRREYAAWAETHDAIIIEDDYDSELASPAGRISTICSILPERTIYINTFSKTIAPSFRTGYMVLPPQLVPRYRERLGFYSCSVPVYDQYVISEFLQSGEFERYLNRRRRKLRG